LSNELYIILELWSKNQEPVNSDIYSLSAEELNFHLFKYEPEIKELKFVSIIQALKEVIQEAEEIPTGIAFDDLH